MLFNPIPILVIEDNLNDFILIETYLQHTGIEALKIFHVQTLSQGIQLLATQPIGLILLDISLSDSLPADSYRQIEQYRNDIPVIVLSRSKDEHLALDIVQQGAQDYLIKDELSPRILEKTILYSIERKKNLATLRRSQEQYRFLFDSNPLPMWTFDLKTLRFMMVNEAAIQHYGYSRGEFLAMTMLEISPIHEQKRLRQYHNHVKNPTGRDNGIWQHLKKNKELIQVEIMSHLIDLDGMNLKLAVVLDITDKIETNKALEKSERVFRSMVESFPNGVITLLDSDFKILYSNGSEYRNLRIDPNQNIGRKFLNYDFYAGQQKAVLSNLKRTLSGETVKFESTRFDNTYSNIAAPISHGNEFEEKIVVITQDITEKIKVEQHLKLLESVIVNSSNGIIIVSNPVIKNAAPEIIFANGAALHMTGYALNELVGKNPRIFQGKETDPATIRQMRIAVRQKAETAVELLNYKKDGTPYWIHLSIVPMFDNKKRCTHFIGLSKNITERKIAEKAIKEANENLRERNRKISEIAYVNSHVIRKPVASILGLVSLLTKTAVNNPEVSEIVDNLELCAIELDSVIHRIAKDAI